MQAVFDRRDLLPLPYIQAANELSRQSGKQRKRKQKKAAAIAAANRAIQALNALGRGELPPMVEPTKLQTLYIKGRGRRLSAGQVVAHRRILHRCYEAVRRGFLSAPIEDVSVGVASKGYIIGEEQGTVLLEPEEVSLPPMGVAGSVDLLSLLPKEVSDMYRVPGKVMSSEIVSSAELKSFPVFVGVQPGKYVELIHRLERIGIVALSQDRPHVVNGIFGVPKSDDKQRLIIDAQRANLYFSKCPDIELPNPGDLVNLCMVHSRRLYMSKADMDNFYHRLLLPDWLTTYFGLPSVVIEGRRHWPRMRVLPMGWSHSVFLAQTAHEHLIDSRVGLSTHERLGMNHPAILGEFSHGEYVDDYFSLGTNPDRARHALEKVVSTCRKIHLDTNRKKLVTPGPRVVTILGIECTARGTLEPSCGKFRTLLQRTRRLVKLHKWKRKELSSLLGSWVWFLLLNRPLLSILSEVYQFLSEVNTAGTPSVRARMELSTLLSLAPLVYADMRTPIAGKVLCSDASMVGGAVVYTEISQAEGLEFLRHQSRFKGCASFLSDNETAGRWVRLSQYPAWLQSRQWKTAVTHRWRSPKHIHILEGEAFILALRWWCRTQMNLGKRVPCFIDNQTLLSAITKGRSSSTSLQRICRRVAALCIAGDIRLIEGWVTSENNPADGPSRHT